MIEIITLITASGIAMLTLPGTIELLLVTVGSLIPSSKPAPVSKDNYRPLAIIIPAHNEEKGIANCIANIQKSKQGPCTIYVIADNCNDNTANVAKQTGATIITRKNPDQCGKGYALDYAFQYLSDKPYEIYVIIDADSRVEPNFIDEVQAQFAQGIDALQVAYGVNNPEAGFRTRLMRVALMAFNVLRPRGRQGFGLSAGILGNGFALTAEILKQVPYDAGSIVEDVEYHLRLVASNKRVHFTSNTSVLADMPVQGTGVKTQRARWEGGRLRLLLDRGPSLIQSIFKGNLTQIEPFLDLMLLPLAFHVFLLLPLLFAPNTLIAIYASSALTLVFIHTLLAIVKGGGNFNDLKALAIAPFYLVWKAAIIPFLIKTAHKNATWVRTERTQPGELKP